MVLFFESCLYRYGIYYTYMGAGKNINIYIYICTLREDTKTCEDTEETKTQEDTKTRRSSRLQVVTRLQVFEASSCHPDLQGFRSSRLQVAAQNLNASGP